jgi:hypothetical protein
MNRTVIKAGDSVSSSTGGNGGADAGKLLAFDMTGGCTATAFLARNQLRAGAPGAVDGVIELGNMAGGLWILYNTTGITERSLMLPDADGTLATQEWAATQFSGSGAYPGSSGIINAQTGTSYTLQSTDNGRVVVLTNAAAITLTIPSGLPAGFTCQIVQGGAGVVTLSASGTTLNSFGALLSTAGQYAAASILSPVSNTFVIAGNLQ